MKNKKRIPEVGEYFSIKDRGINIFQRISSEENPTNKEGENIESICVHSENYPAWRRYFISPKNIKKFLSLVGVVNDVWTFVPKN